MFSETLVILIHGFCREAKDMYFWKRHLHHTFPNILTPDLPTRYSSFEKCIEQLSFQINAAQPEKYAQIFIAGHSMGGLMAREYLKQTQPQNVRCLVCVGTPHYGSKLADIALLLPGSGLVWKPLHALKRSARKQVTRPDISGLQIGAIVSRNNAHWPGKLFLSPESDGLVEPFSAIPPDACSIAESRAGHVKMQYDTETAELIKQFFLNGSFC